jgi:hypothetical protein
MRISLTGGAHDAALKMAIDRGITPTQLFINLLREAQDAQIEEEANGNPKDSGRE